MSLNNLYTYIHTLPVCNYMQAFLSTVYSYEYVPQTIIT